MRPGSPNICQAASLTRSTLRQSAAFPLMWSSRQFILVLLAHRDLRPSVTEVAKSARMQASTALQCHGAKAITASPVIRACCVALTGGKYRGDDDRTHTPRRNSWLYCNPQKAPSFSPRNSRESAMKMCPPFSIRTKTGDISIGLKSCPSADVQ